MTKNKKKKKQPPLPSIKKDYEVTKTYFDNFSVVARKTLQVLDLDPALYDKFTKKQKIEMMKAKMDIPRVVVKDGHSVPRHYVKMIQQGMYEFMKFYPAGKPEIGLRYIDFVTYGMTFLMFVQFKGKSNEPCEQAEVFKILMEKADIDNMPFEDNLMLNYWYFVQIQLTGISKMNFRIYGMEWEWRELDNRMKFAGHIILTSIKPEKMYFNFRNKIRPAFRFNIGQFLSSKPTFLDIPYNKIITESNQSYPLEVYIQSHALMRLKERLDTLAPVQRNLFLNSSLANTEICTLNNGQLVIKCVGMKNQIIGYLPFTIIDKKLLVLSFLPLTSKNTPESQRLQKCLNISPEEINYLGMDKLSFFIDTNFDDIPRLKKAVIDAGLWHLTETEAGASYKAQHKNSHATLMRFFQTECRKEEVLDEIESMY